MTRVKICGISDWTAGLTAIDAGADYLGFVFYPPSPRALGPDRAAELVGRLRGARPALWQAVGVFVNEPIDRVLQVLYECELDVVQLNGEEPPDYIREVPAPVFKAIRLGGTAANLTIPTAESLGAERILVDADVPGRYGGTGVAYDWGRFRTAVAAGFLAGGLTVENVGRAIRAAQPWGVDVSSGVERGGVKSVELIRAFIGAVHAANERGARP